MFFSVLGYVHRTINNPQCYLNPQEIHINHIEYFWARCKHGKKYNKDV